MQCLAAVKALRSHDALIVQAIPRARESLYKRAVACHCGGMTCAPESGPVTEVAACTLSASA
jgi:hypothetical protein